MTTGIDSWGEPGRRERSIRNVKVSSLALVSVLLQGAAVLLFLKLGMDPELVLPLASAALLLTMLMHSRAVRVGVSIAPGWRLLCILTWVYRPETVDRVFRRAVVDMQHEHLEALAERRPWKAGWVQLRGYYSVSSAVIAQVPTSVGKLLYRLWKAAS